jgi:hypothetical protein
VRRPTAVPRLWRCASLHPQSAHFLVRHLGTHIGVHAIPKLQSHLQRTPPVCTCKEERQMTRLSFITLQQLCKHTPYSRTDQVLAPNDITLSRQGQPQGAILRGTSPCTPTTGRFAAPCLTQKAAPDHRMRWKCQGAPACRPRLRFSTKKSHLRCLAVC